MGEQSTINLLSNINGSLNKIVELMLPQNKDNAKADADKVKSLSQGGLSSGGAKPKGTATPVEGLNISVAEIVSTLDSLPEQVLEIAKLADGTIDQFKEVILGITSTLSSKELRGISEKDIDKFKTSVISIASAFTSPEFLAISADSSNKSGELIIALSKLDTLPSAIKNISAMDQAEVQALETFIKSVAAVFKPETFADLDSSSVQKADELLAAITKLDTLPNAVKNASKVKKADVQNLKNIIVEIASMFNTDSFKDIDADSAKSAMDMITALSKLEKLPDVIKGASKVKERDVKTFAKAVGHIMEMIGGSLRKTKVSKDDIQLAQNTADTIGKLTTAMTMLAKMVLVAPLAMVGVAMMIPVWLTFAAVAMLIGKMGGPINKGIAVLNRVDRFLNKMMKTALLGVAVAGSVVLLGMVMQNNMDTMMYGLAGLMITFMAIGVIAILGGLVGLLVKSTNMFTKQIIMFTLGLIAIAGLIVLLGMLVKATWKEALVGLAAMTVMLAYTLVLGLAAHLIGRLGLEMAQLKTMAGLIFISMGLMAMTLLTVELGKYVEKHIEEAMIGLAATLTMLGEVALVAYTAKMVSNSSKSAVKDLFICEGVILGAQAIIYSTVKLGEILWEYVHTAEDIPEKFGLLFVATTAIIMGAWGVTKIANRASKDIKKGAIALLLAEGVILTSAVVVTVMIGVAKLLQESGVETSAIMLTLGVMGSIVAGAGAVALIAGKLGNQVKKGALTIAIIELLILGMVGVVFAIVKTSEAANKLSNGWLDVLACVGFMAGLIVVFTGFAIGIGLMTANPYVAAALSLGLVMLTMLSLVIGAVTGVTFLTVALAEKLEKTGKTTQDLGKLLHSITHDIFTYDNLNPGMSVMQAAKLSMKYMALIPALLGITLVIGVISDMAKKFGGLSEVRGDDYYVSPYYGMNGNEPVFGEPVCIPKIANDIVTAITQFANRLFEGFENVDLKRLLAVGITMQSLIEPVSQFAKMVSGFKNGNGPEELRPVFVSENGEVRYGDSVNVIHVATSIAGAISAFASTLYGNGEDVPQWMKFMGKRRNRKRLERAMNTFALIIEPVDQFVNMLLGYQSAGPGMIKKSSFDDKGNYVDNGAPAVNVAHVAYGIASAISTFASILFGDGDSLPGWMSIFRKEKNATAASRAMNVLSEIITPVSSFLDALMSIEANGGSMNYVWVDEKGNIQRKPVDLRRSANAIAGAIGIFVEELFGPKTTQAWESMLNLSSKYTGRGTIFDPAESPFAAFGIIVEPIANFIKMIADIGGDSSAGDGTISFPIFDKEGNQIGTRIVNLVAVSTAISGAVTKFLETMFSDKNMAIWDSLLYKKNQWGDRDGYSNLDKSIGVFATLIDPVVKFVEVISKFGGTADAFQVYDGEKPRTINLIEVANTIAAAVTTFMNTLRPGFEGLEFTAGEKQTICDFAETVGQMLENFTKIGDTKQEQLDLASNAIVMYFDSVHYIKSKMDEGLPEITQITRLRDTMMEVNGLFTTFNDVKFDELNYKQGLDEFKYMAEQAVLVSAILDGANTAAFAAGNVFKFTVLDQYLDKVKMVHEFIVSMSGVSTDSLALISGIQLVEQMAESYVGLPVITEKDFRLGTIIEGYISRVKSIHDFIVSIRSDFGDPGVIRTGVELVELMASSYLGLPVFGNDINKLAFISDYVNAVSLIRTALFTHKFNSDAIAMTDLVTSITGSVVTLTSIREGDVKAVSNAYTGFLEKMITLSSRNNRKSLTDTHEAFDELTTSMTAFDKQLIKQSDDRKKKLEELIEQVEHLNDKLETTGTSMKKLVDYLEDIEEDKLDKAINAGQTMNTPRSSGSGGSGGSGSNGEGTGVPGEGGEQVVTAGLSKKDAEMITNAIRDAFDGMRLNSGSLTMSNSLVSQSAFADNKSMAEQMAAVIDSLKNLDFEFTTKGPKFYGGL